MSEQLAIEKTIPLMMYVLGVDEETAQFILAIERGEIDGDVIEVPSAG